MIPSFVITRLGDVTLAFRLEDVREVLLDVRLTPIPLSPKVLAGLANLRGEVITALDGATLFSVPSRPPHGGQAHLVIRTEGLGRSIVLDEVLVVTSGTDLELLPTPPALPPSIRDLCQGVLRQKDQSISPVIDARLLVARIARVAQDAPPRINPGDWK